ncbi:Ubiquinone/menaquinone biosynthesis C-methylase UbiE [Algoriphagus ornithinivorans]|uniref:Ubiquinone/menaquinone biosynthesis C-methylase UbiE n=1 Tax=Algoriphagus ornithinivorans TaxID=226506 RepID=A0A1I5GD90_9BACT|nr:methyltransferase domain-containing protein [Algoriphagus ornithinivorans]SFO33823.1 Ubiquinone/menaquinone biosynthesis C-methylase UbiE [Algoriphagus ornithinivorans]
MNFISNLFASSENPASLGAKFRKKRLAVFENLFFQHFQKDQAIKVLDVGGTAYFWKGSSLLNLPQIEIVLLNLSTEDTKHPKLQSIAGDATSLPQYKDDYFDLVFSNSVIEHLYTFENQEKMAKEILRVGKKHFVQTPNKYFPVEAHYALPFAQYFPKNLLLSILTKTKLSRLRKWSESEAKQYLEEIRLLDEKEMKSLFPNSKIFKEKVAGLTKSITAHNFY